MCNRTNYYFLITAFPPLTLGVSPSLSVKEALALCDMNLSQADRRQVGRLFSSIDLYNIRALWLKEPLNELGNFNAKELEEVLLTRDRLPSYLVDFLDRYETSQERLRNFASLYVSLYNTAPDNGFLRKYYTFERELRLCLTALRAKLAGRNIALELQFEDPTDPLVADILAQKEAPDYSPPREFEDLKTIFMENSHDPRKLNRAILEYRFNVLLDWEENQDFSIDRVLGYLARLILVESFAGLEPEKGKETLSQYE